MRWFLWHHSQIISSIEFNSQTNGKSNLNDAQTGMYVKNPCAYSARAKDKPKISQPSLGTVKCPGYVWGRGGGGCKSNPRLIITPSSPKIFDIGSAPHGRAFDEAKMQARMGSWLLTTFGSTVKSYRILQFIGHCVLPGQIVGKMSLFKEWNANRNIREG